MNEQGWIKTTCAYCGVGCGVEAKPNSSGLLDIRGDKAHPANFGKLCTKGIALGDTVSHEGRLFKPTLRHQNDQLETLDWDKATDLVADKFKRTIEEYGADSVAFYVSGQLLTEDYYVANKLIKGFMGTANIDSNSRLCMASSVVGHKRAFGMDTVPVCYDDLEQTDVVILTGSNLAWCHPVLFQRLRIAKQNNPNLIVVVIDPRKTASCDIADLHLAINSGSDVALFNGLLNYLANSQELDAEFISNYTQGFEQANASAEQDSKYLAKITGIDTDTLSHFYQLFARTEKVLTIYSQGINQSSSGSDKVNSILNCHLASGKIGKPGSGPFSITGQPNAMGGREVGALANTMAAHMEFDNQLEHAALSSFWEAPSLATHAGLKAIDMFDAMEQGKIKAVWIMATNPAVSLPNTAKVVSALKKCDFVVVSDCIEETDTTKLANLLLPAQGWSEKSGTVTNSERRISRQRRLLPSPGLAKPDWWIISQVAQKMGFAKSFNYRHEGEIFREHAKLSALNNRNGQSRDFCLTGLADITDLQYSQLEPQQWPVLTLQTQISHQRLFGDSQFYTNNGKARFVPVLHQAPKSATCDESQWLLNTGRIRDHWHTMTRTGLSDRLAVHTSEPCVSIHPASAKEVGLVQGDIVKIINAGSEIMARVEISSDIQHKHLFLPIHWSGIHAKNAKPCQLIAEHADPLSGQPEFKHTPVQLKKWSFKNEALFVSPHNLDFSQFDYWVKQKTKFGYAYRIAVDLEIIPFITKLLAYLDNQDGKLVSHTVPTKQQAGARYASIENKTLNAAFIAQSRLDESQLEWLLSLACLETSDGVESVFLYGEQNAT
ncbi:nitrate reductase [Vibrio tapetis subsp. quintayensis]|uniref:molybdopterin oxidoreductase family protein n=1 Tax=Vibrio tapetis TaxID=52443 RepID=UPI0025B32E9E|nr:nitrate reductase [Vibrio tapetis]MDN3683058.1 nitrate reductase [Vibrio tapetis subsp. quintayensis]